MIINILYIILLLILLFLSLFIFRFIYRYLKFFQKIFNNYLNLENGVPGFSNNFIMYLHNSIRTYLHASSSVLLSWNGKEFFTHSYSGLAAGIDVNNIKIKIIRNNEEKQIEDKVNSDLKIIFKATDILSIPLKQGKNIIFYYVLTFKDNISFINSKIQMYFYRKHIINILENLLINLSDKMRNDSLLLLETIKDYAFVILDINLKITSWNKGAEIMFGYPADKKINTHFIDLIIQDDVKNFHKKILKCINNEEVKSNIKMKDSNNTAIITEILIRKILINDKHRGYYLFIKDITNEEVWKENIKRQSMINKSIVENARDGIILLNFENKIIYINEKVKSIIEGDESYLGLNIDQAMYRLHGKDILNKIEELKEKKIELNTLNLKIFKDWYNVRMFPIKNMDYYEGTILFFVNITEMMNITHKLEIVNRSLIEDLMSAKILQMNLIPSVLPGGKSIVFDTIFLPCDEIGGDFYFIEEIVKNKKKNYIIIAADVSGHGIGASMLTVLVKDCYSDFKNKLETDNKCCPSDFLKMLNIKIMNLNMEGSKFVTVFLILIDLNKKELLYSSAGHPDAYIFSENTDIKSIRINNSPPIGIIDNYVYKDDRIVLNNGDKLCVYTDGILDIFSDDPQKFSDFINKNKSLNIKEIKNKLNAKISAKTNNSQFSSKMDDITVLFTELL